MPAFAILWLLAQERPSSLADEGLAGWMLHARVRAHYPRLEGGLKGEADEPTVGLDDDLDLESPRWTPMYEAAVFWTGHSALHGVGISGWSFATSGRETLDSDEIFQDHLFPAGTPLRSRFRFETFGLDGIWAQRHDPRELFRLQASVGVHYLEAEVRLSGPAGSESEEYSDGNLRFALAAEFRPVGWAFAGLSGAVYTDVLSWFAGVDSGHYAMEVEALGGFQWGPVRIDGGYRVFGWTLRWTKSEIDLLTYGPTASVSVRF